MVDFKALKANRGKQSLSFLAEKLDEMQDSGRKSDDRFWSPTVDKAGNGYAVIRFLPAPPSEDLPFVRVFDHGFQGPGGWYIENSLTTIGQNDPVSEFNSKLWNSTTDDKAPERDQARKQKRRLHFISNIVVVQDPANPDNEGKVFLYKYGKKVFNKLSAAMEPEFEDEEAMNPFDLWEGANFKLKIRFVEGYRNYDRSEFDKVTALYKDDSKLEEVWKSQHSLKEFLDPKNFKSYTELKDKLLKVLGEGGKASRADETPATNKKAADLPFETDEGDDSLEYFKSLAS